MPPSSFERVESPDASTIFEYHDLTPPTTADVYRARRVLSDHLPRTPLIKSEWLSETYGAEIYLKREDTLPTGSFKIRGITTLVAGLDPAFRQQGVITASVGNYGRALAQAARWFDTEAIVAVPEGTGKNRIEGIERLGGRVEIVGADYDDAADWAADLAAEEGYRYVHPGNERGVIAGTGTAGLEIAEDLPDVDLVIGPIGAGSIGAGYGLSVGAVTDAEVIGVQAAEVDAAARAWRSGELIPQEEANTFADGIAARVPYALPMAVMREHVDEMYTVSEAAIIETVGKLFREERILMEGACAPPFALLEDLSEEINGQTIVIPVTGRNLPGAKVEQVLVDR
ncbi:threonine ammonia-lyase [Halorubrum vacuolatum]|uniref:Threonine dehydratase n=1 Tax=Halorubrum vacuolatum TaxID=63740 RepID=A0A238WYA0_HALVU|nr:pyridoxal-phosphate dependent enzyme [Halorubrum vacuolatum]SNR51398.1 threonine dehydratase [Halorubrum vacuolatum]